MKKKDLHVVLILLIYGHFSHRFLRTIHRLDNGIKQMNAVPAEIIKTMILEGLKGNMHGWKLNEGNGQVVNQVVNQQKSSDFIS